MRSFLQQWYNHLRNFTDKKALTILVKCVPPVYKHIILRNSTLGDCLQHLNKYCPDEEMHYLATEAETRKRKTPRKEEKKEDGRTPHEKLGKLPCRLCFKTTHSTLLGCRMFREYIPGQILETKRLPQEVCKLCLGTLFTECQHRGMIYYQGYLCHVSKMNFIICYLCKKHESSQKWLKLNHNPSMGIHNITKMYRAIGTEHVQVNTIKVKLSTQTRPESGITEIEESSQLGNEQ